VCRRGPAKPAPPSSDVPIQRARRPRNSEPQDTGCARRRFPLRQKVDAAPTGTSATGQGTGKTTVALRMASILHRLGYVREGHLVSVTRDNLVGQYIGHTAPMTKEVLKKAMGGVLFIESDYLYRCENERDYGQEAIEILLQVMATQRSVRNAIDRARLRQANRHFDAKSRALTIEDLMTIDAPDIRASRVFPAPVQIQAVTPVQRCRGGQA
jgi:hypothetical protein